MTQTIAPKDQFARQKRLDIQGLRAIAVALVVLFHAEVPGFGGGYVGVDVFFVISGFLISTHLLESMRDRGRVGYGAFYARRARRLLPAAFTVIVATVAVAAVCVSPLQFDMVLKDAVAAAFYVPNMLFAFNATDYLADKTPSLFLHYWSLGVEEQFYLLWPLLLMLLFGVFKLRGRMAAALIALTAASFLLCVWLTGFSQPSAFFLLPARMWEFGLGALVAFALLHRDRILPGRVAAAAGWIGLATIIVSGVLFSATTLYPGYAVAVPVAGTALLIAAGPVAWSPASLLSLRPITWIGDISYSLYLVHWPVLMLPLAATAYMEPLPLWWRAVLAVACVPLAWLLYTYVEKPGQRLAWLTGARPRRTLAAAGAAMATVLAMAVIGTVAINPPLDGGRPAEQTVLSLKPHGTAFVPSNVTPTLADAEDILPFVSTNGCHRSHLATDPAGCLFGANAGAPLVVLFGDSHATQWFPALSKLADAGAIRLDSHTKSACPPVVVEGLRYPECDTWRSGVIADISASKPALIVVAAWHQYMAGDEAATQHWRDALARTISQFPSGSRVAFLADTPSIGVTPTMCLSRYVDDALRCALPRSEALSDDVRRAERDLAAAGKFTYLDYADYLCNDAVCPGVIGNTLVYRDRHHITVTMSNLLGPVVGADISAILAARPPAPAAGPADRRMLKSEPAPPRAVPPFAGTGSPGPATGR
ncbi:MAG: acyltransferase [Mycolicibacterium cosmeticum]|nr:acyltransferase [Mycolicibacterium cosmeticum]